MNFSISLLGYIELTNHKNEFHSFDDLPGIIYLDGGKDWFDRNVLLEYTCEECYKVVVAKDIYRFCDDCLVDWAQ